MSKNYLEAFVIALIAAAFGFFLAWPKYAEVEGTSVKIEEKKAEIKNRQDYYDSLEAISSQLDDYAPGMEKIKSAFPADADSPALMSFVQAAAAQSGMILKDISYDGATKAANKPAAVKAGSPANNAASVNRSLQKYSIKASLAGSYGDYKNFLSRLEHSSRLIQVDQTAVSADKSSETADKNKAAVPNAGTADAAEPIFEYEVIMFANYYQ